MLTIKKNHNNLVIAACSIAVLGVGGVASYTTLDSVLNTSGHTTVDTAQSDRTGTKATPQVLEQVATQTAEGAVATEPKDDGQPATSSYRRPAASTQPEAPQPVVQETPAPTPPSPAPTNPETPPAEPAPTEPTPPTNPEPPTEPAPVDPPANP